MDVTQQNLESMHVEISEQSSPQQTLPLEPYSNMELRDQDEHDAMTKMEPAQEDVDRGATNHDYEMSNPPNLTQPGAEGMPTAHSGIRGTLRKEIQYGSLKIPPFKAPGDTNASAESRRVTYQFPPALLDPDSVSAHRKRFDRSALVTGLGSSRESQIMEIAQIWGRWIIEIPDGDKNKERLLDNVFDMATKAWCQAIQKDYKPGVTTVRSAAPKTPTKRPANRGEELPLGLRGRGRARREVSPSKMPVLIASHNRGLAWAVTAGELQAAGISENRISRRAADEDSLGEDGEVLLERTLDEFNGQITPSDWFEIEDKTETNYLGRDLQAYCLYEVLRSRASIDVLKSYYEKHKTTKQKENTQKRIDEEKEHRDMFMALALELENDDPRSPTPPPSIPSNAQEGSASDPIVTADGISHVHELESLVDAVKVILNETDVVYMISKLELYKIFEDEIMTDDSTDEFPSSVDRCKRVLQEILSHARRWQMLSGDADTNADVAAEIEELELQIDKRKEILGELLRSLFAERDVAKTDVDGDEATDVATSTAVPSDHDVLMAQPSDPALSSPAKRPAADEEDDTFEDQAPVSKKSRSENHRRPSQVEILVPLIEEVRGRLEQTNNQSLTNVEDEAASIEHTPLTNTPHPSPLTSILLLRVRPHFDPEQFTSKEVFHRQGLQYRYAHESTLAQRRSMTDVLDQEQHHGINQESRFGKYQGLFHPHDQERKTIIHGVWDLRDGTRPAGFTRFYSGQDSYEPEIENALMSDTEGEKDEPSTSPLKKKTTISSKRKAAITPSTRQSSRPAKANKTDKGRSSSVHGSGRHNSAYTGTSSIKNHGAMIKPKSKLTSIRLNVSQPVAAVPRASTLNGSISLSRPRRQASRKNYAEQTDFKDDDDKFAPSE